MSTDDTPNRDGDSAGSDGGAGVDTDAGDVRERLEREADRALEQFDEGVIDLLSWLFDTETRARIYVHLCEHPDSTSDEVAEGTGLYPSTVREALADLHEESRVRRTKRQSEGAGNNPYEYSAVQPSDLVSEMVEDIQSQLNVVFNLDGYLDGDGRSDSEPVTITVSERHENGETGDDDSDPGTSRSNGQSD